MVGSGEVGRQTRSRKEGAAQMDFLHKRAGSKLVNRGQECIPSSQVLLTLVPFWDCWGRLCYKGTYVGMVEASQQERGRGRGRTPPSDGGKES